jgi:hypothetical protein
MLGYFYSTRAQGDLRSLGFSALPAPLLAAGKAQIAKIK